MNGVPGTFEWIVGVPLKVECQGKCKVRAICKLDSFSPDDIPTCPDCGGSLKVIGRLVSRVPRSPSLPPMSRRRKR